MPTSDSILSGLTSIANQWRTLAIAWHIAAATLLIAVGAGWRPSSRTAGSLLAAPLLSVAALAWSSGNPFNGTIFTALALLLLLAARRFPDRPIRWSSPPLLVPGVLLVAFGWSYPHFLTADHWTVYTYAAPLGLVPCATLSLLIGLTLALGLFRSTAWAATLAAAGFLYGAIGVFGLGVLIDVGLLAGAAVLAGTVGRPSRVWRSVRTHDTSEPVGFPETTLVQEASSVTQAITIQRPRPDLWPWGARWAAEVGRVGTATTAWTTAGSRAPRSCPTSAPSA